MQYVFIPKYLPLRVFVTKLRFTCTVPSPPPTPLKKTPPPPPTPKTEKQQEEAKQKPPETKEPGLHFNAKALSILCLVDECETWLRLLVHHACVCGLREIVSSLIL